MCCVCVVSGTLSVGSRCSPELQFLLSSSTCTLSDGQWWWVPGILSCTLLPVVCRAFDVEMLYIARYFSIPIAEVAVNWQEIEGRSLNMNDNVIVSPISSPPSPFLSLSLSLPPSGSKLTPLWSGLQMARDLLFLRLRYMFGLWKIKSKFS